MEYLGTVTKIFFAIGGGVSILLMLSWYLIKDKLQSDKREREGLKNSIKAANDSLANLRDTVHTHHTDIEVLKESKIGKAELQQELTALQTSIEYRLTDFKQELRDDLKSMQDNLTNLTEYLMNQNNRH